MENEEVLDVQDSVLEQEEESTLEVVEESTPRVEEVTISKEKFVAMQKKAIAYDASKKSPQSPKEVKINNTLSREEAILIAEGMKVDDLNQLQVIAKGKGISLLEAKSDPLFTGYYENVTKQRKSEAAKLGASKGSGQVSNKPNIGAVGLSEEEHKKLWKEQFNQ